ncbi:GNAT family N-acetyltransferase [Buttiauxella sp.]|uniref:GNAT family N-acetyltransferase n=1 Tax=Buttiauxella sp. TaxID=1972222 RepID=UPI003C74FF96
MQSEAGEEDYLYISAIYVDGNTNTPTRGNPNKYVGLGQILVFAAIKYGLEMQIEKASLVPVDDSQGFYLKMGFHPNISGAVNRMNTGEVSLNSGRGKLNPQWLSRFSKSSFDNANFRGPNWSGNIKNIHLNLRGNILKNWNVVG